MYVLSNARIFNGVDERLQENMDVVVDGEEIGNILPSGKQKFENIQVIDLKGAVLSPGFVDCHQHLLCDELPDPNHQMNDQTAGGVTLSNADAFVAYRGAEKARKTLYAGFTTAVDGGGVEYIDVALKEAINMDYIEGPHYYIVGKQLKAWPSHFRGQGQEAYGPYGVRHFVRQQLYWGVDQIKIENCAPLRSVGRSMDKTAFTLEEIEACCDEAHSAGLLVSAHARSPNSIYDALTGGVDLIAHGTDIDDRCIDLILKQGKYLLPTLASPFREPPPRVCAVRPIRQVELLREQGHIHWESIAKAYKAGVKIALSTDAGSMCNNHGDNAAEMLRMREIGMSNVECLRAATSEAGKAMRLDKIGHIKTGFTADLVVLAQNPVETLETCLDVKIVIKSGRIVKNTLGQ
jgi:imidazolonepropionase-like amidohydrolase